MRFSTKMRNIFPVRICLEGVVEHGFGRGSKTLGYATANLNAVSSPSLSNFLASTECRDGIYIGWVSLHGSVYKAAISVGINPTFADSQTRLLEAHLMDYDGPDFYNETLRVILCAYIRGSLKFEGLDSLKQAIKDDCDFAHEKLESDPVMSQAREDPYLSSTS